MAPGEAADSVRRRFGSQLQVRETSHDVKVVLWLESLFQDIRFGCRVLWKDRAVTAAAVLSLALSFGACSAAFSLIDALMLRPLPVAHADRLFYLTYLDAPRKNLPGVRREHDTFSFLQYQSFQNAAGSGLALFGAATSAGFSPAAFSRLNGDDVPVRVDGISGNAFDLLGVAAAAGRLAARYAESLLFGVKPADFTSLAVPLAFLIAACVFAALRPALIDPTIALRYE